MRRLLLLGLVVALGAGSDERLAEGTRWWSHVRYLASDELQGRDTGGEGHRKAAEYVAARFRDAGLKPAGSSGYFQPVSFDVRQIDEEHSSLELVSGRKSEPLRLGEDATFSLRSELAENVEAPAVFVGYGLSVPEAHYDDLAGLDLRGTIAVYLGGGPASIPGPLRAHYESSDERWKAMRHAGVVGVAAIPNPASMDIPWARSKLARLLPAMSLADATLDETRDLRFSILINPEHADTLFQASGRTFVEILAAADAGKPLRHFPLARSFRAHVTLVRSQAESQNVVALLPGSDPALKDEHVVLTAHLDHLGVGRTPIDGDRIYHGAMDNASGVASLLEIARVLVGSHVQLRRSLLFVIVTGEEKGLLGSKFFAAYPTVPLKSIVADINLDMVLPIHALRYLEVQGLNESTLGDDIRAVAKPEGVKVQADKEPGRNLFIRSDQYSFIRRGVPALAFKFGYRTGSREEKLHKEWLKNRYHSPADNTGQPVDLVAAAEFNRIILRLAERVANRPTRPEWKKDSFFRRFAQ